MIKVVLFAAWIVTFPDGSEHEYQHEFLTFENIKACETVRDQWNATYFKELHEGKRAKLFCEGGA